MTLHDPKEIADRPADAWNLDRGAAEREHGLHGGHVSRGERQLGSGLQLVSLQLVSLE